MRQNPESALAESELSPAEWVALGMRDEDALRRLAGADVSPFLLDLMGAAGKPGALPVWTELQVPGGCFTRGKHVRTICCPIDF